MFDIAWSELLIILVVALVVIGPKELPALLGTAGQWIRRARQVMAEFQTHFQQMAEETEIDKVHQTLKQLAKENPVQQAVQDFRQQIDDSMKEVKALSVMEGIDSASPFADPHREMMNHFDSPNVKNTFPLEGGDTETGVETGVETGTIIKHKAIEALSLESDVPDRREQVGSSTHVREA